MISPNPQKGDGGCPAGDPYIGIVKINPNKNNNTNSNNNIDLILNSNKDELVSSSSKLFDDEKPGCDSNINININTTKKYSLAQMRALKNNSYSWVPPEVSPIEIIAEYLAVFDLLEEKRLAPPPQMIWVPKSKKAFSVREKPVHSAPKKFNATEEVKLEIILDDDDDDDTADDLPRRSDDSQPGGSCESDDLAPGVCYESDEARLKARQKQIDIGKNTPEYRNYISLIRREDRKRGDPLSPNKFQVCSKRSWDGQVRKWRRMIHRFDPQ
jgi:hypothetical protein